MKRISASSTVSIPIGRNWILGDLTVPGDKNGAVIFAHGSGSSRHSPRNKYVAEVLNRGGFATLLIDLLTADEERVDMLTAEHRFDIELLSNRLVTATDWADKQPALSGLTLGYFGASTGAAAALVAAAERPQRTGAVVSRGGRPDLAGDWLGKVAAPTLFIIGELDYEVITLNREAAAKLRAPYEMALVSGATHLFEEEGALEHVAALACEWFHENLVYHQAA